MRVATVGAVSMAAAAALAAKLDASAFYDTIMKQANASIAQVASTTAYPSNSQCTSCYGWATTAGYNSWTAGFFPGLLLKLNNYTSLVQPDGSAAWWLANGAAWSNGIASNEYNTGTHDVGFMVVPTFVAQYKLTGNTTARDIAITTAHSLAVRFSPVVGCIRSWGSLTDATFEVIIDNMMNLELLWWAADESGNATLRDMAASHSAHMIADIYQPFASGCVWHLVVYNTSSGAIISRSSTPQGLGQDTVWARGQAWATHGFTIAHRYTGNATYLDTAFASAECFMRLVAATSVDAVPPWDFNVTAAQYSKDTSAAAIFTSAVIELAWYAPDAGTRTRYLAWAATALKTLTTTYANDPAKSDAVLKNGTTTYPSTAIGIIYGDYYLLEALMKYDATPQAWRDAAEALAAL